MRADWETVGQSIGLWFPELVCNYMSVQKVVTDIQSGLWDLYLNTVTFPGLIFMARETWQKRIENYNRYVDNHTYKWDNKWENIIVRKQVRYKKSKRIFQRKDDNYNTMELLFPALNVVQALLTPAFFRVLALNPVNEQTWNWESAKRRKRLINTLKFSSNFASCIQQVEAILSV